MKIVFVGSNPSAAANSATPFDVSTSSGRILMGWIAAAELTDTQQINVANYVTENNRPLKMSEIKSRISDVKIQLEILIANGYRPVALGKTATRALELTKLPFLEMPHPSGLNRKLNDLTYVGEQIERLRRYAEENSIS